MVTSAFIAKDSLNRLNCEWSDFADQRLKNIMYNFMDEDEKKQAKEAKIKSKKLRHASFVEMQGEAMRKS